MTEKGYSSQTYSSFILRGKDLDPREVTDKLMLTPSKSFSRGDIRSGLKKWPHGYWELESTINIHSSNLELHLKWIIEQIEPVKPLLADLLNKKGISAVISCFWLLPKGHDSLTLDNRLLERLGDLGLSLEFDVYTSE